MKLDNAFNKLSSIAPESELLSYNFSDINWGEYTERQKKFPNHGDTFTFRFLSSEFRVDSQVLHYNRDHELYPIVMKEVAKLEEYFDAKAKIAVLAGVKPKGVIGTHRDMSELFQYAHRVHLPLDTGPEATFVIDDVINYFEKGQWIEIDNTRLHSVYNGLDRIRVHLLVDLVPNSILNNYDKRKEFNSLIPRVVLGKKYE